MMAEKEELKFFPTLESQEEKLLEKKAEEKLQKLKAEDLAEVKA